MCLLPTKKEQPIYGFPFRKINPRQKEREIQHEIFLLARVFHASSLLSCFISSRIYIRGTYSTFISLINSIQEFCTFSAFECSRMRNFWCLISGQRSSLHKAVQHEEHIDGKWPVSGTDSIRLPRGNYHCRCL